MSATLAGGVAHTIPQDMRRVLLVSASIAKHWNSLTPLARNEWICWVVSVKKKETRAAHLVRLQEDLRAGKRRPCCWAGCSHRTKGD